MLLNKETLPLVPFDEMNRVHLKEVDRLNDLYELILVENSVSVISRRVHEFMNHCKVHFNSEEELMRKYDFFALDCHTKAHSELLNSFEIVVDKFSQSKKKHILLDFFKVNFVHWFLNHLKTMDYVTASFLAEKHVESSLLEV